MRRSTGAAIVALALAGGCAGDGTGAGRPDGTPELHPAWRSCEAELGGGRSAGPSGRPQLSDVDGVDVFRLPLLDDGFAAVAVTVCGSGPLIPPGGANLAATERRAESVDALVAALRLPDEPRSGGPCTADLVTVPWFALHDAQGRWIRPGVPANSCGKPRREVRDALAGLTFTAPRNRAGSGPAPR
jgi:hypothetical protein